MTRLWSVSALRSWFLCLPGSKSQLITFLFIWRTLSKAKDSGLASAWIIGIAAQITPRGVHPKDVKTFCFPRRMVAVSSIFAKVGCGRGNFLTFGFGKLWCCNWPCLMFWHSIKRVSLFFCLPRQWLVHLSPGCYQQKLEMNIFFLLKLLFFVRLRTSTKLDFPVIFHLCRRLSLNHG